MKIRLLEPVAEHSAGDVIDVDDNLGCALVRHARAAPADIDAEDLVDDQSRPPTISEVKAYARAHGLPMRAAAAELVASRTAGASPHVTRTASPAGDQQQQGGHHGR